MRETSEDSFFVRFRIYCQIGHDMVSGCDMSIPAYLQLHFVDCVVLVGEKFAKLRESAISVVGCGTDFSGSSSFDPLHSGTGVQ